MDFNLIREHLLGADLNKGLQVGVGVGCGTSRVWHHRLGCCHSRPGFCLYNSSRATESGTAVETAVRTHTALLVLSSRLSYRQLGLSGVRTLRCVGHRLLVLVWERRCVLLETTRCDKEVDRIIVVCLAFSKDAAGSRRAIVHRSLALAYVAAVHRSPRDYRAQRPFVPLGVVPLDCFPASVASLHIDLCVSRLLALSHKMSLFRQPMSSWVALLPAVGTANHLSYPHECVDDHFLRPTAVACIPLSQTSTAPLPLFALTISGRGGSPRAHGNRPHLRVPELHQQPLAMLCGAAQGQANPSGALYTYMYNGSCFQRAPLNTERNSRVLHTYCRGTGRAKVKTEMSTYIASQQEVW